MSKLRMLSYLQSYECLNVSVTVPDQNLVKVVLFYLKYGQSSVWRVGWESGPVGD